MVKGIKFRRGTTADHSTFTGQEGEITVDTTKDVAIVHDGITVGGYPLVGENSTQRITNKDINATALNVSGVVTATSFRGDGSQLTGISAGGGTNYWRQTSAGIHTLSNVGIGTTNPRFALEVGAVGASGTSLLVNGDARITGILTIGTSSITLNGNTDTLTVPNLIVTNNTTGVTASGVAITVRDGGGDLGNASIIDFGDNLSVSLSAGIATITGSASGSSSQWTSTAAGIHTLSNVGIGTTNPTSALTVKGNTSLETLSVSGVSTFVGNAVFQGNINLGDNDTLYFGGNNALSISSPGTVGGGGVISGGVNLYDWLIVSSASGGNTVAKFRPTIGDGSDNVELYYGGSKKFQTIGAGVTVTGTTFTNQLSVSGVSTFSEKLISLNHLEVGARLDATAPEFRVWGGNAADDYLQIFAGSNEAYIRNTGTNAQGININARGAVAIGGGGSGGWSILANSDGSVSLALNVIEKLRTIGAGVTVTGTTFTNQLSVSGVSTLTSNVSVGGTISIDGGVKLVTNNATIVGTAGTVGEIKRIGGAPFFYDGSAWREFVLSSGTPVSVPADTEWDNVVFRATFDDNFTDAKFGATPVRVSSGSTIVGAAVIIGTGAFRNDGAVGSGVSYAYRSDYDFTGSWTIEFWMNVDSSPAYNVNPFSPLSLVSMNSTTGIGTSGNWTLAMWASSNGTKFISWWNQGGIHNGGTTLYTLANVTWNELILDKWNHFALVREGDNGSLHFYVNGFEQSQTISDIIIDNDILDITGNGLHFGGGTTFTVGGTTFNSNATADVIFDDVRISCGVGTAGQRYNSIGITTYATFTPPATALPTTGTLSSYVQPPGDKYGEITLGGSPTWRGTSGVTVSQQSSGNYRVSFASTYTNANDYFVLSQPMDQGFASYVGVARSTTHTDFAINRESDNSAVNTGSLSVQIKNHI